MFALKITIGAVWALLCAPLGGYLTSALLLKVSRRGLFPASRPDMLMIFRITKWPALLAIILGPFAEWCVVGEWSTSGRIMAGIGLVVWILLCKADDDDWWKKRKKQILGRIERMGHKLVVIPRTT